MKSAFKKFSEKNILICLINPTSDALSLYKQLMIIIYHKLFDLNTLHFLEGIALFDV